MRQAVCLLYLQKHKDDHHATNQLRSDTHLEHPFFEKNEHEKVQQNTLTFPKFFEVFLQYSGLWY